MRSFRFEPLSLGSVAYYIISSHLWKKLRDEYKRVSPWLTLFYLYSRNEQKLVKSVQGVKLIFFSDSHLAPKLFKVVANSKKLVAIFKDK